ncbi:MAG: hypothetical protein GY918_00685, partial [Gammaproteobacteria bacterium]|nr:hypothetical protein [Gammaproteobacteria bacterium]
MSDTLQIADLVNGKLDVGSIAGVAMVGTTSDTITNREGVEIDTLEGRLKKVGFEPPVAYSAGIEFLTPADAVKSFDQGGIIYGCLASSRPFTTTGNFAADEVNFFVIQNTSGVVQGNVRTDVNNTYAPGTTQSMPALEVNGVDFTAKNAAQDQATASAASAASVADGKAVAAQSTANTANGKANTNTSSIATINARPYVTQQGGSGNIKFRKWSDGRVEAWGTNQTITQENNTTFTLPLTL